MERRILPMKAGRRASPAILVLAVLSFAAIDARGGAMTEIGRIGGHALSFPCDAAVDRRGVTFLLDSGTHSVAIFSPSGEFLREVSGRNSWKDPSAIAVTGEGTLLVADGDAGRVLELDLSGKVRREFPVGRNSRITGVGAFGDTVYAVDNRTDRIVTFRRNGTRAGGWGKRGDRPGEFHAPFRLAVDVSGRIFVTDVMNARVQWFSPYGQHLGTLKKFGAGKGRILRPAGLSVDTRGRIWITDSYAGLVQLFDEKGNFVEAISEGDRPKVFGDPVGVAVAPQGLWVADQKEGRLGLYAHH